MEQDTRAAKMYAKPMVVMISSVLEGEDLCTLSVSPRHCTAMTQGRSNRLISTVMHIYLHDGGISLMIGLTPGPIAGIPTCAYTVLTCPLVGILRAIRPRYAKSNMLPMY